MANVEGAGSGGGKKKTPSYSGGGDKGKLDTFLKNVGTSIKKAFTPSKIVTVPNKATNPYNAIEKKPATTLKKPTPKVDTGAYNKTKAIENASKNTSSTKSNAVVTSKTSTAKSTTAYKGGAPTRTNASNKTTSSGKSASTKTTTTPKSSNTPKTSTAKTTTAKTTTAPKTNPLDMQKKAIQNALTQSAKGMLEGRVGDLKNTRDQASTAIANMLAEAQGLSETDTRHANDQFEDNREQIYGQAFNQGQLTDLMAYENGIQNSQQMLGLKAGDNARTNGLVQTAMTERDRRIFDIQDRLALVTKQAGNERMLVGKEFNNGLERARGDYNSMIGQGMFGFNQQDYFNQQQNQFANQDRDAKFAHDVKMFGMEKALKLQMQSIDNASAMQRAKMSGTPSLPGVGGQQATSNAVSGLASQYNAFKNSMSTSELQKYQQKFPSATKKVLGAPPTVAQSKLSPWEQMKMFEKDYGNGRSFSSPTAVGKNVTGGINHYGMNIR